MKFFLLLFVVSALFVLILLLKKSEDVKGFRVKRRFLDEREEKEYSALSEALSDYLVFPKVRVLDAVVPEKRNDFRALGKVASKRIDFLITDKKFKPIAAISRDETVLHACREAGLVAETSRSRLVSALEREAFAGRH